MCWVIKKLCKKCWFEKCSQVVQSTGGGGYWELWESSKVSPLFFRCSFPMLVMISIAFINSISLIMAPLFQHNWRGLGEPFWHSSFGGCFLDNFHSFTTYRYFYLEKCRYFLVFFLLILKLLTMFLDSEYQLLFYKSCFLCFTLYISFFLIFIFDNFKLVFGIRITIFLWGGEPVSWRGKQVFKVYFIVLGREQIQNNNWVIVNPHFLGHFKKSKTGFKTSQFHQCNGALKSSYQKMNIFVYILGRIPPTSFVSSSRWSPILQAGWL